MGGVNLSPPAVEEVPHRWIGEARTEIVRPNLPHARTHPSRLSAAISRDFPFTQRGGYAINDLW